MSKEIVVPALGESVTEATVGQWFKKPGDAVEADEPLVELETDKVAVEVNAPSAGTLGDIFANEGDTVEVGAVLGNIGEGGGASTAKKDESKEDGNDPDDKAANEGQTDDKATSSKEDPAGMAPAAARLVEEKGLDASRISGSGRGGRITKADVLKFIESGGEKASETKAPAESKAPRETTIREVGDREERVPMSRLRRTIAKRLKDAQNTAAMLTTFNEVDMTELMAVRKQYRDLFEQKHGVRLGFMSFFAKACVTALKEIPAVNAEIDGDDIIYKNHYDIGVAVSAPQGLVVPVLRDVDLMSLAGVEKALGDYASKARDGDLALSDLQGGTFTISNGGVFGSLMSTPILNPPQSGILGMHKIEARPVVVDGEVVVRQMMYLALSYDHRIVDGREAVTFLVRVKECLEDPARMLLDL
jgi:2-oxoglutarate dehydrogenase E2 component (dihydrolipoamide succinyltransferase)